MSARCRWLRVRASSSTSTGRSSTTGVAGPDLQEGQPVGHRLRGPGGTQLGPLRAAGPRRRPGRDPLRGVRRGARPAAEEVTVDELTAIADALYAGPADEFTDARNRAAKDVGDKELSAQIKKLKKPSVAAWAVNLLVRRESEQIDSVLGLAGQLRAAAEALDGNELRALTAAAAPAHHRACLLGEVARARCGSQADRGRSSTRWRGCSPPRCSIRWPRRLCAPAGSSPRSPRPASPTSTWRAWSRSPSRSTCRPPPCRGEVEEPEPVALHVVPDGGAKLAAAEDALEEATRARHVGRARAHRGRGGGGGAQRPPAPAPG